MNKTLHFLSGIPRSGSTVLAAILNQNPLTHVSTTSGLVHILDGMANTWTTAPLLGEKDPDRDGLAQAMCGVIDATYAHIDKPVIIDKSRGWPIPTIMFAMAKVLNRQPRIIATVRSVPDCAASFVRIAKPADLDEFMRSEHLMTHLKAAYISLQGGYMAAPENFCIVDYDDLMDDPKGQLERIHAFLELPPFEYDFTHIDGSTVSEDDENLHGYAGMHDVKPVLERQHNQTAREVLGKHYHALCQPEFWLKEPKTIQEVQPLDLMLAAGLRGDFAEGWTISEQIQATDPTNNRAAFNRGWYLLRQGKIQEGYKLLDRGRLEGVFGNTLPNIPTQKWNGKSKGTVLLILEGGLGDQIHQTRYAAAIAARGCRVVVACSGPLCGVLQGVEGVSAIVQQGVEFGVYHDFYVQGMSAIVPLGLELGDLSGKPYIDRPATIRGKKKRVGLRWSGLPQFEHEQHRRFPPQLMFNAVKDYDAEFISLQRDEGADACPSWVKQVPLDSWEDTRNAIASCNLVISSCTSVSHLAGAMGVKTWVVLPILPYFLYALDGEKTPYYDSFTLFRQEQFGDWRAPFKKIHARLQKSAS